MAWQCVCQQAASTPQVTQTFNTTFEEVYKLGATVTKNNRHIDFPFELDVAPYGSDNCKVLSCIN